MWGGLIYDDEPTERQIAFLKNHGVVDAEFLTFEEASEQIQEIIDGFSRATEKQLRYLWSLGVPVPDDLTREEASEMIDEALNWGS